MTKRKAEHERKGMGRPHRLTAAQVSQVFTRYRAGELLTVIAAEYGVHRNTLYRAVGRARKDRRT